MSATGDSLQLLARFVATALRPFLSSVGTDGEVTAFVAGLGWSLPSVPPAIPALGTTGNAMLDALTAVENAADALADGTGDEDSLLEALATLLLALVAFASEVAGLSAQLNTQLPGPFLAATGIADNFETRLFHDLAVRAMTAGAPTPTAAATLVGLIDQIDVAADPAHFQPAYTQRTVRFDRLGKFFNEPLSVLADVYGWGTPTLNLDQLAANVERVSYPLLGPIEIRYPTDAMLAATAPGTTLSPDDGSPPGYTIPIFEGGPVTVVLAIVPLPKASPTELQGIAFTLQLELAADTSISLGPQLALTLDGTLDLSSGVAAVLRPDRGPAIVMNPEGTATPPVSGKGGARLVYGGTAGPTRLLSIPGGSFLEAQQLYFGAGVDATAAPLDVYIEAGITTGTFTLSTSGADGFLATILPSDGITTHFDFGVAWSQSAGLRFSGAARLETTFALNVTLGPFALQSIYAALAADGNGASLELSATGGATIGPISASVERLGVILNAAFQSGNLGPVNLSLGFKPPSGLGIDIEAGPISGGGFVSFDPPSGRYAGVLSLSLYGISITAIALLDTKLPGGQSGFSFLVILSVQFDVGIQLGFGFTLSGVGGLCGINRSMLTQAIQDGLRKHALDAILFPPDPVRNAPQIISELSTIYPPAQGRYVFGPILELGWGTPTLISAEIGVIIEVPSPIVIAILGQLGMALPTADAPLIELHIDVIGVIDFGQQLFSIDATIHDSRIALFTVTGDMAFRLAWGADPSFLFAVGGFNPQYQAPPTFPSLQRLTVAWSADVMKVSFQAYVAVSSNTFQLGAQVELYIGVSSFNVYGWLGFDALIVYSPFSFVVDFNAGLALRSGTDTIMGISVDGKLSGPAPWHAEGDGHVSLLFFDVSVHVSVSVGDPQSNPLPVTNAWTPLQAAIGAQGNWSGALPPGAPRVATLAPPEKSAAPVLIDPAGVLTFREKVLPLNQAITRFGEAVPDQQSEFDLAGVTIGGQPIAFTTITDEFARAQFEQLSDADKLSLPSFEPMIAGFTVSDGAVAFGKQYDVDIEFKTEIIDSVTGVRPGLRYKLLRSYAVAMSHTGAAARGSLFTTGIRASDPGADAAPLVALDAEQYVVAGVDDLSVRADIAPPSTKGAAFAALARHLAANPGDAGSLQVVPAYELPVAA